MTLDQALILALKALVKRSMRTAYLGLAVFDTDPKRPGYRRGEGSHGTNKYCRLIGKVIKKGEKMGLISIDMPLSTHAFYWKATEQGKLWLYLQEKIIENKKI